MWVLAGFITPHALGGWGEGPIGYTDITGSLLMFWQESGWQSKKVDILIDFHWSEHFLHRVDFLSIYQYGMFFKIVCKYFIWDKK